MKAPSKKNQTKVNPQSYVDDNEVNSDGSLTVQNGVVFCTVCNCSLANKASTIKGHVNVNQGHKTKKERQKNRQHGLKTLKKHVTDYMQAHQDNIGFTDLTSDDVTERLQLLQDWMTAGLPLDSMS